MGFGKRSIEIITENPIEAQEEIKRESQESTLEKLPQIVDIVVKIIRLIGKL